MEKENIKPGVVYRNKKTDQIGIVFTGHDYGCTDHSVEVPIIYRDDTTNKSGCPMSCGTLFADLEPYILNPKDILTKKHIDSVCRPGVEFTCAYLMMDGNGFSCAKTESTLSVAHHISQLLLEQKIHAKGNNCGGKYRVDKDGKLVN